MADVEVMHGLDVSTQPSKLQNPRTVTAKARRRDPIRTARYTQETWTNIDRPPLAIGRVRYSDASARVHHDAGFPQYG